MSQDNMEALVSYEGSVTQDNMFRITGELSMPQDMFPERSLAHEASFTGILGSNWGKLLMWSLSFDV